MKKDNVETKDKIKITSYKNKEIVAENMFNKGLVLYMDKSDKEGMFIFRTITLLSATDLMEIYLSLNTLNFDIIDNFEKDDKPKFLENLIEIFKKLSEEAKEELRKYR